MVSLAKIRQKQQDRLSECHAAEGDAQAGQDKRCIRAIQPRDVRGDH